MQGAPRWGAMRQVPIKQKGRKDKEMKTRSAVAILLLAIFAFSTIATIQIKPVKAAGTCTLPDAEMMLSEFILKNWGGSPSMTKTNVDGPGVQFDLTGLGKAGIMDEYELNSLAGGALNGGHYSDFTGYSYYSMLFINVGSSSITVKVFMNTGFTNGGLDPEYDAFWCGNALTLAPGESGIATLNFSNAEGYNLEDDPVYTTPPYNNGGHYPIYRLNEVTSIGFEVTSSGSAASLIVSGTLTHLYIDPPETNKGPGDVDSFFDVYVKLENFANFAGFDIKLTWDSTLLTQTAVDYTTALDALWGAGPSYGIAKNVSGAGYYNLVAYDFPVVGASNTGASNLFMIRFRVEEGCNFQLSTSIHFDVAKLTDNSEPVALPITATVTDGMYYISGEMPRLAFALIQPDPIHLWEETKYFQIEVHVLDIHDCSPLRDYDFTLLYDSEFVVFVNVSAWGVLGDTSDQAQVDPSVTGVIHIWDTGGLTWDGTDGLLFRLTFLVQYDDRPAHIWKYLIYEHDAFEISMTVGTLSFGSLGTLNPDVPPTLSQQVGFIRGDVDADGQVWIFDLQGIGSNYGLTGTSIYDLTGDSIVDIYDVVTLATNYDYGHT